jgi:hypothetical protein
MSIYVEILVRVPMDALWCHTQTPALHERWDLRFSRIKYLPRKDESLQHAACGVPSGEGMSSIYERVLGADDRVWGPLFGYRGSFSVEWRKVTEVPSHILPKRQERRD